MLYKIYRILLWVQGIYSLTTALWALFDIDSFMKVSGPKTDIWLVKTVSVLLVAIAICLLSFLFMRTHPLPAIILGGMTALGLILIDIYYTANHTIKWVYLLDAVAEAAFLLVWLILLININKLYKQITNSAL